MSDSSSARSKRARLQTLFRQHGGQLRLSEALDWHGITTQIPHQVHLAVERDARLPVLDYPPVAG
ncbi:MAG: hypothetical protein R3198_11770 [Marinobacter sp.]|nr:hypothetical protein [Marinobacter sp.]